MPKPEPGESRKHYMERCPSIVMNEGTTKNPKQAVAICYSLWKQHHKNAKGTVEMEILADEILKQKNKEDKK